MTRLQQLFTEQRQSPWLDNLTRGHITGGRLARYVGDGIRGVTSNPTIFEKAIAGSADYDDQFRALVTAGVPVEDAYWELVIDDIHHALHLLNPLYDASGGEDGFVSIEVAPGLAHDTDGTLAAARDLSGRIAHPNCLVKIPATAEGVAAIGQAIAEGMSINVTLIFSLTRYDEVIEAYLSGLEARGDGDLSGIHSVASFFVSRVDTEVDRRLARLDSPDAAGLVGQAAVAQAKVAYQLFRQRFTGPRWEALVARGARLQRPLWASTSTKNPALPDTLYVDSLIGPDTVDTLPEPTIAAFEDHGTVARTVDHDVDVALAVLHALGDLGIDMADVAQTLETEGVASFTKSFDELMSSLRTKAAELAAGAGDR
jgi:transaldolase